MLSASALPVSNTVLSLVMWSLAEDPVSLVIVALITGAAGAAVSMVTLSAVEADADIAGRVGRLCGEAVGAIEQRRGGVSSRRRRHRRRRCRAPSPRQRS